MRSHTAAGPIPLVEAATIVRWLAEGRAFTILDVRPGAERAEWSIPGSLHVDAYDALRRGDPDALSAVRVPLGTPVVTVCAAGRTSLLAAGVLRAQGHQVYSLDRGMMAWSTAWDTAVVASGDLAVVQVRRLGKGCLSYLAVAGESALVIDPSLDARVYISAAEHSGAAIQAVLETHVHADHLSRARQLCSAAGARLLIPEQTRVSFPHTPVRDGDHLPLGGFSLRALRTPGHTAESTCYLLDERFLFTGDTLFLSGVGRPDLEGGTGEAAPRARDLYLSLQRLLQLPATVSVLPGHASGPLPFDATPEAATLASVCSGNPLVQFSREEFVRAVLEGIPALPPNHAAILRHNETGTEPAGDPVTLEAGANRCAVV